MLPTSAGVEPATSWSPVGRRIQLSHRGRLSNCVAHTVAFYSTKLINNLNNNLRRFTEYSTRLHVFLAKTDQTARILPTWKRFRSTDSLEYWSHCAHVQCTGWSESSRAHMQSWIHYLITFSMLWTNSSDDKLMIFFLFFRETRIWSFKFQSYFLGKIWKLFQSVVSWNFHPPCKVIREWNNNSGNFESVNLNR